MPKQKRFQITNHGFSITEDKTITVYRVHDTRDDIFVGIDFCVANNPFLSIHEARKVAFYLNSWTSYDWNKARKEADYIPDWM